jgi:hypothetical protein
VIGENELDRLSKQLATEIGDRHFGDFDRRRPCGIRILARLIVEHAELDRFRRRRLRVRRSNTQENH